MKFSEHWLRTFVNPPLTSNALADALTMGGIEVEAVEAAAPAFSKVIVAEVLEVTKHPDADRLNVCRVNTGMSAGNAVLQIVCGAPNVKAGIRVPLAQVGAQLPGMIIKLAKVRGVESNGMLCSAKELGISDVAEGLLVLPTDAPIGTDLRSYLELDDKLFTIKPTPNRGDCLNLRGIAREVAAITDSDLLPVKEDVVTASIQDRVSVVVEASQDCPRYCTRYVRGVNATAKTPVWIVRRLERSGVRSISAIVDITNYVMLETGQPLHAFNAGIVQGSVHVRRGKVGEKIVLLNGVNVELNAEWLVIADDKNPLALAGIMGGEYSGVTNDTHDVLLESAFFTPEIIVGKARLLGANSDAAYRFERGVDFEITVAAIERATALILEICGGKAGAVTEVQAEMPVRAAIRLRHARVQRLLGIEIAQPQVRDFLIKIGCTVKKDGGDVITVVPPSHRFDLMIEEDLVEEIARLYGYDSIPAHVPFVNAGLLPATELRVSPTALRATLAARDYREVITYSFVERRWEQEFCANDHPITLANPIAAQLEVMRSSLIASLADCLRSNLSRQQERIRIFEIGRCFTNDGGQDIKIAGLAYGYALPEQWSSAKRLVDFYDVKADIETLLITRGAELRFETAQMPAFHPGRSARVVLAGEVVGWLGELHPALRQKWDFPYAPIAFELNLEKISKAGIAHYHEISKQPTVRRDISVEVLENIEIQRMLDAIWRRKPAGVIAVTPFDVYRGKGIDSDKKSIAFKVLLQDTDKTLTDEEIESSIKSILDVLQEEFDVTLRK